jgi:hypothetical protein
MLMHTNIDVFAESCRILFESTSEWCQGISSEICLYGEYCEN